MTIDKKQLRLLKKEENKENEAQVPPQPEETEEELFRWFSSTFGQAQEEQEVQEQAQPEETTSDPQEDLRAAVERLSDQVDWLEQSIRRQQEDRLRAAAAEHCRQGRRSRAYGFLAGLGIAMAGIPLLGGVIALGWELLDWLSDMLEVSPACLSAALVAIVLGAVMLKGSRTLGNWLVDWTTIDFEDEDEEV